MAAEVVSSTPTMMVSGTVPDHPEDGSLEVHFKSHKGKDVVLLICYYKRHKDLIGNDFRGQIQGYEVSGSYNPNSLTIYINMPPALIEKHDLIQYASV